MLVYGTLRRGESNSLLFAGGRGVYKDTVLIHGFAFVASEGGWFPYAVSAGAESSIVVEVVALSVERRREVLDSLDRLEGYREDDSASLYTREIVSWSDHHGMRREGFIYVPSEASQERIMRGGQAVIPGGDWLNRYARAQSL